jgi:hypothetical protein
MLRIAAKLVSDPNNRLPPEGALRLRPRLVKSLIGGAALFPFLWLPARVHQDTNTAAAESRHV